MIRLLFDKVRLSSTLAILKNTPKVRPPLQEVRRCFSSEVASKPSPANAGNLAKDVVVFQYENPRFYHVMNAFTISQFLFWGFLGHWSYTSLRDTKVPDEIKNNEELSWWRKVNLGEGKYKNTLAAGCLIIAYAVIFVGWTFTLRSVRYLIALKNGKDISLVTYTPFGKNRIITVPINCISAQESRMSANTYLPLKVKNRGLFYILDMKGEFKNTKLYDHSIGLNRKF